MLSVIIAIGALTGSSPIVGTAQAGDGDSLTIGSTRIRLFGIDAPELDQTCQRNGATWPCGADAADRLARLVNGRHVTCIPVSLDPYDRVVARCTTIGTDINQAMVASGYALAFRKFSTLYVAAEDQAKAAKRGIWSGTFALPSEVRARMSKPSGSRSRARPERITIARLPESESGSCVIKGNHSRRGGLIYHLPGMPYYAQTRAEQMFCSEAAARAAGYRRARSR